MNEYVDAFCLGGWVSADRTSLGPETPTLVQFHISVSVEYFIVKLIVFSEVNAVNSSMKIGSAESLIHDFKGYKNLSLLKIKQFLMNGYYMGPSFRTLTINSTGHILRESVFLLIMFLLRVDPLREFLNQF